MGRIPRQPGRQWLCFVVKLEGAQVAPGWVAAQQFDAARFEHEPKEQPAKEKQHPFWERRRGGGCGRRGNGGGDKVARGGVAVQEYAEGRKEEEKKEKQGKKKRHPLGGRRGRCGR